MNNITVFCWATVIPRFFFAFVLFNEPKLVDPVPNLPFFLVELPTETLPLISLERTLRLLLDSRVLVFFVFQPINPPTIVVAESKDRYWLDKESQIRSTKLKLEDLLL